MEAHCIDRERIGLTANIEITKLYITNRYRTVVIVGEVVHCLLSVCLERFYFFLVDSSTNLD